MNHQFHLIDGYWLADGEKFRDRLVTSASMEDFDEDEDCFFFFDIDEEAIKEWIELGEGVGEEFVITDYRPVKIANDASESPRLEAGEVEIWYRRDWLNNDRPDPDHLEATHVLVGRIKADSLDQAFCRMQGDWWSPNGEARNFIRIKGLCHTSMSTHDVIVFDGVPHLVTALGFEELEKDERSDREKLVDRVIEQMREDFELHDLTAVAELLSFCPEENLRGYLSEEVEESDTH